METAAVKKDIEQAWSAYFDSVDVHNISDLEKEGWKAPALIHKPDSPECRRMAEYCNRNKFEREKFRIKMNGAVRAVAFYRPSAR